MLEDTRKICHTESTKQDTYGLTETEASSTGLIRFYTRSSAHVVAVSLVFCGNLNCGSGGVYESLPALGTLFLLMDCLVQPGYEGFCLALL